ncbi:glycosyltransferase family 4 protein [Paenibacillus daejeonensis]|uniref:glycosyltransferase family 4 protein n=1 Tax=Paenibacillus daejeonensis TaxID=135193 RepID=UPI0003796353|nr:glycosyltransferase family 4 protein [Paenibacillus daejeonensis]
MKVLLLADQLIAGGLETHIVSQINELLRRDYEIRLAAANIAPELLAAIEDKKERFHPMRWDAKLDMDAVMQAYNPDIVHAHPFTAIVKGAALVSRNPKPFVVTIHGRYDFGIDRSPTGYQASSQICRIIAVDQRVSRLLLRSAAHPEKVSVIPNGIDLAAFAPAPAEVTRSFRQRRGLLPDAFTLVTVCRLADGKQHAVMQLIRCASRIADRLGGLNLLIVGSGAHGDKVQEKANEAIKQRGSNLRIQMAGHRQDVTPYMQAADLVMACGRAAMEAMACGTAVYGMRDGFAGPVDEESHDMILGSVSGFQPMSDEELIREVEKVARDHDSRAKLASTGRRIIARSYDLRACTDQLERIYTQYGKGGSV